MQRGGVDIVVMVAKGTPPEAGKPEAEPHSRVNLSNVVAAIMLVLALLLLCPSRRVYWEAAFAK